MKEPRILIVNNTSESTPCPASVLSNQGYAITRAECETDALKKVDNGGIALIVLNLMMSEGGNALGLCQALKNKTETNVPIIALVISDNPQQCVQLFQGGVTDYLLTPYCETEFISRVMCHLQAAKKVSQLEQLVKERTKALEVMTRIRDEIRKEEGEKVKANVYHRIFPYVSMLEEQLVKPRQKEFLKSITGGLADILSAFSDKLASTQHRLTPAETQVAVLIREGKTTKMIADMLCLSENTIIFHRQNVRKKLGLTNGGTGLKEYLNALT